MTGSVTSGVGTSDTPRADLVACAITVRRDPGVSWVGFRAADGRLLELWAEPDDAPSLIGGIARARVLRVDTGLSAVIVRLPEGMEAFVRDAPKVAEGDALVVQIARDAAGTKRPVARTAVELAEGPLLLTPRKPGIGLSSAITGKSRRADIKALLERVVPEDLGLVVRAAGAEVAPERLAALAGELVARWREIERRGAEAGAPEWLTAPPDIETAARRHAPTADLNSDTPGMADGAWDGVTWDIEVDLDHATARRVAVPGGGVLIVDEAEAATLIDVDLPDLSGGKGAEDLHARLAEQVARLARLRGLRGTVLVDFPRAYGRGGRGRDGQGKTLRQAVERRVREVAEAGGDPLRVLGWTPGGMLELIREGARRPLSETLLEPMGAEMPLSPRAAAWRALARLQRTRGLPARLVLEVEEAVARWLMGPGAGLVDRMRARLGGLTVAADPSCPREEIRIRSETDS